MPEELQKPEKPSSVSKKEVRKQRLLESQSYRMMKKVALYMDQYYLDGVAGLVPGGLGDMAASALALVHVYFSLYKLRSIPLTLAVLNNAMRDVLMGMLPFFVGDVIDFFNKSHSKNMKLIDGYINNDPLVVHRCHCRNGVVPHLAHQNAGHGIILLKQQRFKISLFSLIVVWVFVSRL